MRDRNKSNLQQFNIQLKRQILKSKNFNFILRQEEYFSQKSCLWRSDTKHPNSRFRVRLPRNFNLIRSLIISHWYFPKNLHILVHLELEERSFNWFNSKQKVEIGILLSSEINCVKYLFLTERYTSNEIFGNILGNDLNSLEKEIKIYFVRQTRAKKKIFRRGPKDYGSRRSDSTAGIIQFETSRDVFLQLEEELYQKNLQLLQQTINKILNILENYSED